MMLFIYVVWGLTAFNCGFPLVIGQTVEARVGEKSCLLKELSKHMPVNLYCVGC